jgi:hypothetical protein
MGPVGSPKLRFQTTLRLVNTQQKEVLVSLFSSIILEHIDKCHILKRV